MALAQGWAGFVSVPTVHAPLGVAARHPKPLSEHRVDSDAHLCSSGPRAGLPIMTGSGGKGRRGAHWWAFAVDARLVYTGDTTEALRAPRVDSEGMEGALEGALEGSGVGRYAWSTLGLRTDGGPPLRRFF